MKSMENKIKLYGQVFSGPLVAKIIAHFIEPKPGLSVIDPMCGIGDLLLPYLNIADIHGVELDSTLEKQLKLRRLESYVKFANSFDIETLKNLSHTGYDVVITNPPYIRKENLKSADSHQLSLEQIKMNLISFVSEDTNLNLIEKKEVIDTIVSISGLADIAVMAWILCMVIVKENGYLGIVVPNSWLTREYAKPIKKLLLSLFNIQTIINDVNNTWFAHRAQIKTNIVICQRRSSKCKIESETKIISLHSSFDYNNLDDIDSFQSQGAEVFLVKTSEYINNCGTSMFQNSLRKIFPLFDSLPTLSDYGIKVSQGLRSGANKFFYLKSHNGNYVKSTLYHSFLPLSDEFFLPLLHKQSDLKDGYSFSADLLSSYVLNIQESITAKDMSATPLPNRVGYLRLPYEIEKYITHSERIPIKGTAIPQLSSVKTNVCKNVDKRHRFWYMLPVLQERHFASIVIPRVNSHSVTAFVNPTAKRIVVDANFLTFVITASSELNPFSLLAILNSSFCKLQFEEIGTPMGGGALKLDAVQVQRLRIPVFKDVTSLERLISLGERLSITSRSDSAEILDEIDILVLQNILETLDVSDVLHQIKNSIHIHSSNRL